MITRRTFAASLAAAFGATLVANRALFSAPNTDIKNNQNVPGSIMLIRFGYGGQGFLCNRFKG